MGAGLLAEADTNLKWSRRYLDERADDLRLLARGDMPGSRRHLATLRRELEAWLREWRWFRDERSPLGFPAICRMLGIEPEGGWRERADLLEVDFDPDAALETLRGLTGGDEG